MRVACSLISRFDRRLCVKDGLAARNFGFLGWGLLNLAIPRGQFVGLSGVSGSGKSLLLRALADLVESSGELCFDGMACHAMSAPQWRRLVGLLPASPVWWEDSVGSHFHGDVVGWLDALGFGVEVLGWDVARLSSGEKQRLALVRLLARRPQALLLDEPTASLDSEASRRMEGVVRDYVERENSAVLWVSHDPEQLERLCSCRLVLSNRTLREEARAL